MVDKHLPHLPGGDGQKRGAIVRIDVVLLPKAQKRLMDQRGWLKRMVNAFTPKLTGGNATQLLIERATERVLWFNAHFRKNLCGFWSRTSPIPVSLPASRSYRDLLPCGAKLAAHPSLFFRKHAMRCLTLLLLAALLAATAIGCSSEQEEAFEEQISLLNEFADELEDIESNTDLIDAKPDLEKLAARMRDAEAKLDKLEDQDISEEELIQVLETYSPDLERAQARVKDQMERIGKDVGPQAVMQVGMILGGAMEGGPNASAAGQSSGSSRGSSSDSSTSTNPLQREAEAFVKAELAKRWLQNGDVWTSEIPLIQRYMDGRREKIGSYYLQMRAPRYTVDFSEVGETDKLHGLEYIGSVDFESSVPKRSYGAPDEYTGQPGEKQWSQWGEVGYQSITINKRSGEWILDTDDLLVTGEKPTNVPG